jgi:hypothetical protein
MNNGFRATNATEPMAGSRHTLEVISYALARVNEWPRRRLFPGRPIAWSL